MKTEPLGPLETTWEAWRLGGGARACFESPDRSLHVEIGPGDDDFLLESAEAYPECNWLGIEYSRKRVHRYVKRVMERTGVLGNLRLIWRPAADVVGPFLTPARVEAFHIYFPDPWPKKHHHRYRLLDETFLADMRDSLVPGGEVHVCTDHPEYVQAVLEAFALTPGWQNLISPPGWRLLEEGEIATVFEGRWRREGRTIHRLHWGRAE